ncbi:MAG: ATP-binding protein, partial [Chloroflexota bacterium]
DYMKALRASSSQDMMPIPLIRKVLDDFGKTAAIEIRLAVVGAERTVPAGIAHTLQRITQEALTNVTRHANASEVTVTLTFKEHGVELTIEDNGAGFQVEGVIDKAYTEGRFGILGMRERCDGLGGTFKVEGKPGRGTKVSVWLPSARLSSPDCKGSESDTGPRRSEW